MNNGYEQSIEVSPDLIVKYLKTDDVANIFINSDKENKVVKSALTLSFRGLLNQLAYFSKDSNYTIDFEGIIIYNEIINIDNNFYIMLEDTLEYYDEELDTIAKDYDEDNITLYSKVNDHEIASYSLDDSVKLLFDELEDIKTNAMYQQKLNVHELTY